MASQIATIQEIIDNDSLIKPRIIPTSTDTKKIAAIAPICSEGDASRACTLQDVPVWVFHGAQDDIVPSSYSDKMVQALQDCDVYVKYTLYPDVDHFAWVPAYNNPALYDWMLQQQRK